MKVCLPAVLCVLLTPALAFAGNTSLTTYYPAPNGNYKNVNSQTITVTPAGFANSAVLGAGCSNISPYVGLSLQGAFSGCTNYSLLGDGTNLFVNRPTNGGMYFRENNADEMTILSGGNVGISATAPQTRLHIASDGNAYNYGIFLAPASYNSSNNGGLRIWYSDQGSTNSYIDSLWGSSTAAINFRMEVAGTPVNVMTITGNGNIGMGVTIPTEQLAVSGAGQATQAFNTAGAGGGALDLDDTGTAPYNGGALIFSAATQAWKFAAIKGEATNGGGNSQGDISFQTRPGANDGSLTNVMLVESDGQVVANDGLTVQGVTHWPYTLNSGSQLSSFYGGSPEILANGDNHTGGGIAIADDGGFFDYNDGYITFNGSTGLKIASNNGASSDNASLVVQGQITVQNGRADSVRILDDTIEKVSGSSDPTLYVQYTNSAGAVQFGKNSASTSSLRITPAWSGWPDSQAPNGAEISNDIVNYKTLMLVGNKSNDGTTRSVSVWDYLTVNGSQTINGNLTVTGNITALNGCIQSSQVGCAASDRRLKKNIATLTNVLPKLDQLRGVSFEWNHLAASMGHKEGERNIGMIAQELQKVYPELVATTKNSKGKEYLAIDYSKFTAVLLQSIKELKTQNNQMQQKIDGLEKKVDILEKEHEHKAGT